MQLFAGAAGPGEGQGEQAHQFGEALGMGEVGILQIEAPGFQATEQGFDGLPVRETAQYLRGWMGYFGTSEYYRPIPALDQWIRRRIRLCYWKQCRWTRTKVRNRLALGMARRQAILPGFSSKSY